MNQIPDTPLVRFYKTPSMRCPYLKEQREQLVFTHLKADGADALHSVLAQAGFRRSHNILYRPDCPSCTACIPVRVKAAEFRPSRSQRRVLAANHAVTGRLVSPSVTVEQFELFVRYQNSRHGEGSMARMDYGEYRAMVEDTPVDTLLIEYRDPDGDLVGLGLTDRLRDGLSMVYSFFAPEPAGRSLGTFIILDHIRRAPDLRLAYVYLGYWIAECHKMAYKSRFQPMEALGPAGWSAPANVTA